MFDDRRGCFQGQYSRASGEVARQKVAHRFARQGEIGFLLWRFLALQRTDTPRLLGYALKRYCGTQQLVTHLKRGGGYLRSPRSSLLEENLVPRGPAGTCGFRTVDHCPCSRGELYHYLRQIRGGKQWLSDRLQRACNGDRCARRTVVLQIRPHHRQRQVREPEHHPGQIGTSLSSWNSSFVRAVPAR